MSDIICPTCGTNGLDCLRKDCQMVADQLAPWTGREVFASMASAPEPMPADFFPETHEEGDAISGTCVMAGRAPDGFKIKLGFVHTGKSSQDWRLMKALRESVWMCLEWHRLGRDDMLSLMAIDDAPKPLDPGAGAVAGRVDGVIQDALAGRLTKGQKAGVRSAIDRSDRVSPSSDQAVGKAIGG